jgi:tetrahydromethanopterin S-methyltransferase subunit G
MQEIVTKQRLSVGLVAAIMIPAAAGFIAWGSNNAKVAEIERHVDNTDSQVQTVRTQLSDTQRSIAVQDTQYAEIIRRLDQIDHKLESK